MLKGFVVAVMTANAFEWTAHKYFLHGVHRKSKPRYSPTPTNMKSHWEHHREVRKQDYHDDGYNQGWASWRTRNEVWALATVSSVVALAALPVSKGFSLGVLYSAGNYFYTHRRSHMDPAWGKRHIPWHYDHHMNSNQDANWCVTKPWFDYVMGTRVVSSDDLKESNPLGIWLPKVIAEPMTQAIAQLFPVKYVEQMAIETPQHSVQLASKPVVELTAELA